MKNSDLTINCLKLFLLILFITFIYFVISGWLREIENPIERGLAYVSIAIAAHSSYGGRRDVKIN